MSSVQAGSNLALGWPPKGWAHVSTAPRSGDWPSWLAAWILSPYSHPCTVAGSAASAPDRCQPDGRSPDADGRCLPIVPATPALSPQPAFGALRLPHRSMPRRARKGQPGYHRVFHLIVEELSTGRKWKCCPIPPDPSGTPGIPDTTVTKVFATQAEDGSLWQAFIASVRQSNTSTPGCSMATGPTPWLKRGNGIGDLGDKPRQGEHVIAITDNHGDVLKEHDLRSPLGYKPPRQFERECHISPSPQLRAA
jgi:hypothetical protein